MNLIKRKFQYNTVDWWNLMVKSGIKEIAILKTKEHNISRYGVLNMLLMKQIYFNKQALAGIEHAKIKLSLINLDIKQWFISEAESAILLINAQEIEESENMNLYNHEIHMKKITRSAILSLDYPQGLLTGHKKYSNYNNENVTQLLENKNDFNKRSKKIY